MESSEIFLLNSSSITKYFISSTKFVLDQSQTGLLNRVIYVLSTDFLQLSQFYLGRILLFIGRIGF